MHENDRYDEIHAELASGEGMPEAPHPPTALPAGATMTYPPGEGMSSSDVSPAE